MGDAVSAYRTRKSRKRAVEASEAVMTSLGGFQVRVARLPDGSAILYDPTTIHAWIRSGDPRLLIWDAGESPPDTEYSV